MSVTKAKVFNAATGHLYSNEFWVICLLVEVLTVSVTQASNYVASQIPKITYGKYVF